MKMNQEVIYMFGTVAQTPTRCATGHLVIPLLNSLHAKCRSICIRDKFSLREVHINLHGILGKAEPRGSKAKQGVRVNPCLLSSNKSRPHLSTYVNLIKGRKRAC